MVVVDAGVARPATVLACEDGTTVVAAAAPEPTWACTRSDGVRHGPFVTLFPDDTIEISGAFVDGVLDGAWTRHRADGSIAEHGTYRAGHRDGRWRQLAPGGAVLGEYDLAAGTGVERTWYDAGGLYRERTLTSSVADGPLRVFALDGSPLISAQFRAGELHGDHAFGSRGTMRFEETFVAGVRRGKRTIWQLGRVVAEERYDRRGRLDGPYVLGRTYGGPRAKGRFSHGQRVGEWTWWDRSRKKERAGRYVNGKRDGAWTEWWEGKVASTGAYTVGKPDGEFTFFDRRGNELGKFTITGGTGTMLTFHGNRRPATRQQLVDGVPSGSYQELTTQGRVVVDGRYRAGVKHGTWSQRTFAGAPLADQRWSRGKLDGPVRKYVDGRLATEAHYVQGKAHGAYAEFRDGKPAVIGSFADDRRDGVWTTFDADGAVIARATYKAGVLHGPWQQRRGGVTLEGEMVDGRRAGRWIRTEGTGRATTHAYSPGVAHQPAALAP